MQIKKLLSSSVIGTSVSFLVLITGASIIIMNYFSAIKGEYLNNIQHNARDIYYKFALSDDKIINDVYGVFQKNISSIYDPQQLHKLCKDMAEQSPYIRHVYLEYAPDFFVGMHAFCPYYDVASDSFKNLADSSVFNRDYLMDDVLFKRIYESNGDDSPAVSASDDFLRVQGHRLMIHLMDKNSRKVFVVINAVLSPDYNKDICSSITSWRSGDSLIIFNSQNRDVLHNTFASSPDSILSQIENYDSNTVEQIIIRMIELRKDTANIIYRDNNIAWTFVYDSTLNTGMICHTEYRFMTESFTRLLTIIGTFALSILIIIITNVILTKKSLKLKKKMGMTEKDLYTASKIQRSMLPSPIYDIPQLYIDSCIIPAKDVGGDLYYFIVRNNYLYFCIGDVSGKGLPASLFMSKSISLFACISRYAFRADDIAEQLNLELCMNNDNCMFITMFIGILNLKTGELQYCNAGHDEPIFWDGLDSSEPYYLSTSDNLPLGVEEDMPFIQGTMWLKTGSCLFLYTDGVTEAKRKDLTMYGEERLVKFIAEHRNMPNTTMCNSILEDVRTFVNENEQSDDITMLSIKIKQIDRTIILTNDISELKKLPEFFNSISEMLAYPNEELVRLRVAIDEVMTNCILYAYPDEKDKDISLRMNTADGKLFFTVIDSGIPFNPLEYNETSLDDIIDIDAKDIKIGGLGIPLMKEAFDLTEYQRIDNKNILTLTKKL